MSISCRVFLFGVVFLCGIRGAVGQSTEETIVSCCTAIAAPYVYRNDVDENRLVGLSIDYLEELRRRTGIRCRNDNPEVFQSDKGTAWNELLNTVADCKGENCRCQVGVGAWFENENRMRVDFLPAYIHDSLTVMIHEKDTTSSTGGAFFLTAFSPTVWICIAMLILVFTFLKLLDRRFAPPDHTFIPLPARAGSFQRMRYYLLKSKIPYRLRRATQSTFSRMIGQNTMVIEGDDSSTRQWVLNFAIALCGIFLILSYEATMTASLVQEKVQSDFRKVEDFKNCRINDKDVCFVTGDITSSFWQNSIAKQPCRQSQSTKPKQFSSYQAVTKALAERKCKYVVSSGGTAGTQVHGRYCGQLTKTGEPFFRSGLSFVLPKNSSYYESLRKATLQIKGEDQVETLDQYFSNKGLCEVSNSPRLTFDKLQVFFILAFVACLLIFLEMVVDPQKALASHVAEKQLTEGTETERSSVEDGSNSRGQFDLGADYVHDPV